MEMLRSWLVGGDTSFEETPFTAVRRVPGGHELLIAADGASVLRRYWAPSARPWRHDRRVPRGGDGPARGPVRAGGDPSQRRARLGRGRGCRGRSEPVVEPSIAARPLGCGRGQFRGADTARCRQDLGLAQRWLRLRPDEVDLRDTLDLVARLPFLALGLTAGQFSALDAEAVGAGTSSCSTARAETSGSAPPRRSEWSCSPLGISSVSGGSCRRGAPTGSVPGDERCASSSAPSGARRTKGGNVPGLRWRYSTILRPPPRPRCSTASAGISVRRMRALSGRQKSSRRLSAPRARVRERRAIQGPYP